MFGNFQRYFPVRLGTGVLFQWTLLMKHTICSICNAIQEYHELWLFFGRREKTPTPKTRFTIWTLLRTPGRFTTRPLPVYFTTKMSVVRPFSVLSKDEIGP